ncbi:IclR family transcriptional regulator [Rhizobium paknamense]|uniref:DNA-binding IclR family transcriptional regulator n=1 Tax=Rhizobium paknamense TaxID=1206817 RepID=A0ABU0IJK4_9HYPH|nr:IclR family transcriptional regulator [Rhizobium paknamense]MDQ0458433.1 DNA-binding IclR family transcriptional regulator [Rhizobium paknamense]
MSTIAKAMHLLNTLADMRMEPGLTDIAIASGMDKATTRRMLVELSRFGFVEQDATTRRYRLGSAPVRLSRIREQRYPFASVVAPFARALVEATGETVHVSEPAGEKLATVHVEMSDYTHRVMIDAGQLLPFHATASGLAFLSTLAPDELETMLSAPLAAFTQTTLVSVDMLRERLNEGRKRGYCTSEGDYEQGVMSAAAAIVDGRGMARGTIAVAGPAMRVDRAKLEEFGAHAAETARQIERALWGTQKTGQDRHGRTEWTTTERSKIRTTSRS